MPNPSIISKNAYKFFSQRIQDTYSKKNHSYTTPQDTTEDDTSEQQYETIVVCGDPLRKTKCVFVTEMNDFYTDEELNTVYHSADEYRNSFKKYGLIYKSQKFENADTPQKLLEYATDWIKNNYHGGITSFSLTVLDMHNLGIDTEKYLVGQRVRVRYIDPAIGQETQQILTAISAEYNLNDPSRNNYKIGIPDVTLNKVYGETVKSGGGGGGGKSADETDNEVEVDDLEDEFDKNQREVNELIWNTIQKVQKEGNEAFDMSGIQTPTQENPTGDFGFLLRTDALKTGTVNGNAGIFGTSLETGYLRSYGGIDAESLGANKGNFTDMTAKEIVSQNGSFSNELTLDGVPVATLDDVAHIETKTVRVLIDNIAYKLYGEVE